MKKILNYLGVAAIALTTLASCDLDSMSMTEKDTSNFPTTKEDCQKALAGVYANLNGFKDRPQETFLFNAMLASDDMLGGGGYGDKSLQALDLLKNYGTDMTKNFFLQRYEGINRANTLLEALDNVKGLDEANKNETKGQVLFLRAFFYYELASMYNRVPLILTAKTPDDLTPPSAATIWGQILYDLKTACDIMPAKNNHNSGSVDKYCAEALLGRAWLYYTGMYCNGEEISQMTSTNYAPLTEVTLADGSKLTKQDVIGYIDDCVNNSGYKLVDDYRSLWAYTNKYTVKDYYKTNKEDDENLKWCQDDENGVSNDADTENMFDIKFNKLASWNNAAGGNNIGYCNYYCTFFGIRGDQDVANTFPFGQGWGAGPVAPNLMNDWTTDYPNDKRRDASVQITSELPAYAKAGGGLNDYIQETDYYNMKLGPVACKTDAKDANGNPVNYYKVFEYAMYGVDGWSNNEAKTNSIHDLVIIRFADVLLMQAELKEEVTNGLKQIMQRAGLDVPGSYSLDLIKKQRRYELAFEGTRWNDIRRWHIAAAELDKQANTKIYTNGIESRNIGGYSARYKETAGFQKIPEKEVTNANGQMPQNPGWTDANSNYNGWNM